MEMETIHAKLYKKYEKLKARKFSEFEESGRDQEEKFVDYVSTAEELIEHLRSENDKLKAQLSELNDEVSSTKSSIIEYQKHLNEECHKTKALTKEVERLQNLQKEREGDVSGASPYNLRKRKGNSDSVHSFGGTRGVSEDISTGSLRKKKRLQDGTNQYHIVEYQKHLNEECHKTKALTKEVERLQNLQQEREGDISCASPYNLRKRKGNSDSVHSSGGTRVVSEDISTGSLRKNSKKKRLQDATNELYDTNQLNLCLVSGSDQNSHGGYLPEDNQGLQHEKSSSEKPLLSGQMGADLMLQSLMESLSGLKFAFDQEAERLCLHAVHPSSGYSFSLMWFTKAAEEDVELLYHVFSLGTIQRVALEWMKEDIVFSLRMFPTFLGRVSKVLGLQLGCT